MNNNPFTLAFENPSHEKGMACALEQAALAAEKGETPVGAALMRKGELLLSSHNLCKERNDPTLHAELIAVQAACAMGFGPYLSDCILYATLEPCCQCAAALAHCHLGGLVFAAYDLQYGACGGAINLSGGMLPWSYPVWGGYMRAESETLLHAHFSKIRAKMSHNEE